MGVFLPSALLLGTAALVGRRSREELEGRRYRGSLLSPNDSDSHGWLAVGNSGCWEDGEPTRPIFGFWGGLSMGLICGLWIGFRVATLYHHNPMLGWLLLKRSNKKEDSSSSTNGSDTPVAPESLKPQLAVSASQIQQHHTVTTRPPWHSEQCHACAMLPRH
eukprot:Protomagalhaensia_sp_Gyna_25__623@NODE_1293_length_1976_cov_21_683531_g1032_i0_p2_GENE_NODE_1293_length_1976_cov_21_683531_g1032_i0NODE_1293_length_1976_cov_21_683531_g1032_i0_p2_ORF_typecomplete_len162_score18_51TEX19/PF15553_6/0_088_NODE_1293_length_1976_cov_21_683531_g1032_i036521